MAELTISGTVQKVLATEVVGTNDFHKREIILRTDDQYPQDIAVQFVQDKCELLDKYVAGDKVNVSFNLRGKLDGFTNDKGETKYFNTVQGWKIARVGGEQPAQPAAPSASQPQQVYVHTNTEHTEAAFKQLGWKEDALVAGGYGYFQPVSAPVAPAAPKPAL